MISKLISGQPETKRLSFSELEPGRLYRKVHPGKSEIVTTGTSKVTLYLLHPCIDYWPDPVGVFGDKKIFEELPSGTSVSLTQE